MLDPLLTGLAAAADDEEAARQLEVLLERTVLPLVRAVATRKLGLYGGFGSADVDDVVGEATLVLVERLQRLRGGPPDAEVATLDGYVATVVYHCCARLLRRRHPERARLKHRLRYVLDREPFAIWQDARAGTVCGLAAWRGREPSSAAHQALEAMVAEPDGAAQRTALASATPRAMAERLRGVFSRLGGPVELDRLVAAIAPASRHPESETRADAELRAPGAPPDAAMEARRAVERLWAEVCALPVRQRVALLLHLRDAAGGSVLWLLPVLGLASIRRIAATLELSAEDLAALWPALPADDRTIAARLGCTRQQVINLRMAARKRLSARLGNLRRVSPSKEGDT